MVAMAARAETRPRTSRRRRRTCHCRCPAATTRSSAWTRPGQTRGRSSPQRISCRRLAGLTMSRVRLRWLSRRSRRKRHRRRSWRRRRRWCRRRMRLRRRRRLRRHWQRSRRRPLRRPPLLLRRWRGQPVGPRPWRSTLHRPRRSRVQPGAAAEAAMQEAAAETAAPRNLLRRGQCHAATPRREPIGAAWRVSARGARGAALLTGAR